VSQLPCFLRVKIEYPSPELSDILQTPELYLLSVTPPFKAGVTTVVLAVPVKLYPI